MKGIIYKYTNNINGKCYVGQTMNEQTRIQKHKDNAKAGKDSAFYRAIRKYGYESFNYEVIVRGVPDYLINPFEKYWIMYYNAFSEGYNMTVGGEGKRGYKVSEETRAKMSEARKGYKMSEDTKQKLRDTRLSTKRPKDVVEKISKSLIGNKRSAKLNTDDVVKIRQLLKTMSQYRVAELFNVGRGCIAKIDRKETWKDVA